MKRKILQDDGLMISASVVQSPVFYGHAADGELRSDAPAGGGEARDALPAARISNFLKRANSRLRLVMPQAMPASPSAACITITVCRSRSSSWSVADNVRFGGALMAVKIAEAD